MAGINILLLDEESLKIKKLSFTEIKSEGCTIVWTIKNVPKQISFIVEASQNMYLYSVHSVQYSLYNVHKITTTPSHPTISNYVLPKD